MKKLKLLAVALSSMLVLALVACGGEDGDDATESPDNGEDGNGEGIELGEKDIKISCIAWAGALARTPIVKKVLEEAGYNVEDKKKEEGPAWQDIADEGAAFARAAWLAAAHADYWERSEDDVDESGIWLDK